MPALHNESHCSSRTMDPLLDIERRTGVGNDDIDEFLRKVTDVETKIRALTEGKDMGDEVR